MESQQLKQSSPETHKQKTIFSQAGLMSLEKSKYQEKSINESRRQFQSKILQQINNDDEFTQLPNITTTYLPLPASLATSFPENERPKKEQPRKTSLINQSEYQNVASRIRQNSQSVLSSLSKKKYERPKKFNLQGDEDLTGIEQIIGDIQRVMEESLSNSKAKPSFKKDTQLVHHAAKRQFQTKGIHKFGQKDSLNKLEEMLLHYQMDDPHLKAEQQPIEIVLKDAVSQRKAKNEERTKRIKQFNGIAKQLKVQPEQTISKIQQNKTTYQKKQPLQKKQGLGLQNIEIIEIDWFKLPLFLAPLSKEGLELALKMKECPDDESYWIAINESISEQTEYKAYSIFNSQCEAGITKAKTLMSQEQFRQRWAEEWAYDIDEEQHKELLCELDFQWYRSLVQATYNQNIEDILIKNIQYEIEAFKKALKSINGGPANDKNIKPSGGLPYLITVNKLKYVEGHLNEFAKSKAIKTGKKALFVAVVPNIGDSQSKQIFEQLKLNLKQMFVGGLYSSDSSGTSMGVMVTKQQAGECGVGRWEGERVQLGEVDLLINEKESAGGRDSIYLSRSKSKNSSIKLRVLRSGEQEGVDLQVGEELHMGRRYHILLD